MTTQFLLQTLNQNIPFDYELDMNDPTTLLSCTGIQSFALRSIRT